VEARNAPSLSFFLPFFSFPFLWEKEGGAAAFVLLPPPPPSPSEAVKGKHSLLRSFFSPFPARNSKGERGGRFPLSLFSSLRLERDSVVHLGFFLPSPRKAV